MNIFFLHDSKLVLLARVYLFAVVWTTVSLFSTKHAASVVGSAKGVVRNVALYSASLFPLWSKIFHIIRQYYVPANLSSPGSRPPHLTLASRALSQSAPTWYEAATNGRRVLGASSQLPDTPVLWLNQWGPARHPGPGRRQP